MNRELKELQSLADLPPLEETIDLVFQRPEGNYQFTLARLSHEEWNKIRHSEPDPDIPEKINRATGLLEWDHTSFKAQRKINEREGRIELKLVTASVVTPIPGGNLDEKADWLSKYLRQGELETLSATINAMRVQDGSAIITAERFQAVADTRDVGDGEVAENP